MAVMLTRQTDYALVALAALTNVWRESREPLPASAIAIMHQMPSSLVVKILKRLQLAGILHSRRGVRGGYVLARPPEEISVEEVIHAVDGPVSMTRCGQGVGFRPCAQEDVCPIRQSMRGLSERMKAILRWTTLATLEPLAGDLAGPERRPVDGGTADVEGMARCAEAVADRRKRTLILLCHIDHPLPGAIEKGGGSGRRSRAEPQSRGEEETQKKKDLAQRRKDAKKEWLINDIPSLEITRFAGSSEVAMWPQRERI